MTSYPRCTPTADEEELLRIVTPFVEGSCVLFHVNSPALPSSEAHINMTSVGAAAGVRGQREGK